MEMVQAFADDSVTPELVTCGVAVYELSQVSGAEAALAEMKQAAGGLTWTKCSMGSRCSWC